MRRSLFLGAFGLVLVCTPIALSANADVDSLKRALLTVRMDSARVNLLNGIANGYAETSPDSTIRYAERALELAGRIDFGAGAAEALLHIGTGHLQREEYGIARTYFQRSLDRWSGLGRTDRLIELHHNMSYCAQQASDFPQALVHALAQLKLVEAMDDPAAAAAIRSTVGNIHDMMGNEEEAEQWQKQALHTYEELKDSVGIARASNNLGTILDAHGKGPEALKHLERALAIARALGNPMGEAICTASIANHYQRLEQFEKALALNQQVISLFEQLDDPFNLAAANINAGEILMHLERYDDAKAHLRRGAELAGAIGAKQWLSNAHAALYDVAMRQGDADAALLHFTKHIDYRDSIQNEANTRKAVQAQMQYDFEKKEAVAQAEHEEELRRQRLLRNGSIGASVFVALFAGIFLFQRNRISKEKDRSEELLLNILPAEVAEELKAKGAAQAVQIDQVTVLFTDFKGFTAMSEVVTPQQLVRDLNECFSAFDRITEKYGIEKIKTIGDAYMAAGGLPTPNTTHALDVIKAALEMRDFIAEGKARKIAAGLPYFEIRIGIHTGPVVAGIVGVKKFQYDIWGDTVNTASRMESSGEVGRVNISEATYRLVKDASTPLGITPLVFTPRGKVLAKGKGEMEMYFVEKG